MKTNSFTYYNITCEVFPFNISVDGVFNFESETEAISKALEFKNNPQPLDGIVGEQALQSLESEAFTIVKKTFKSQVIRTI